jgi:hypothetical protein
MDEPAIIERLQAVRGELSEIKAANQVYWGSKVNFTRPPNRDRWLRMRARAGNGQGTGRAAHAANGSVTRS